MRHFKELAILALASTVIARAIPDEDGDDAGVDDYDEPPKGPPPTGPKPTGPPPTGPKPTPSKTWTESPPTCTPTYEAYICNDEDGKGDYKTTFTIYPSGCPLWEKDPSTKTGGPKSWVTVPAPTNKPVDPWAPAPVKPTTKPVDPWAPVTKDPWVEWGVTKDEYDWWVLDGKKGWPGKPGEPWVPGKDGKPGIPPKPAVPSGWGDWNKWVAPKPTDPAKWNDWTPYTKVDGKTVVIITKTETYYVPCSTGWETKSTTWYTSHCGCTETPVPVKPVYVTLTTECPTTWGLGKTVVYSTPDCTYTPVAPTPVKDASTWVTAKVPVEPATTWAVTPVKDASTWAVTPVKDASTWAATPVKGESTWAAVTTPAAATGTWSPVGVWKGAASSNSMSSLMVVGAGAVAGLAYLL